MSLRSNWYSHLNEPDIDRPFSIAVTVFLSLAIITNIAQSVLGSVGEIASTMGAWYELSTYVFTAIFAAEYVLRIWVAAEKPHEQHVSNMKKRLAYIMSPMGIIDLLSFLPAMLWILLPDPLWVDLRMLKLISMVRVLKLTRYSASLVIISRVLRDNKNTLLASAMVMFILMLIAATGIFVFEHQAQPEDFGSIPSSMWWAFVTLTTVGYGDVTPVTIGGKIFGSAVMVCGVGIAAMPAGIFASSFVQLIREQEHERRRKHRKRGEHDQAQQASLQIVMSTSEEREVKYLMEEYDLTLDQAVGVVTHFRRGEVL